MPKKLIFSFGLSLAALVGLAAMPHSGILSYIAVPAGPGNYRNSEGTILNLGHHRLMLAWTDFYTSNSSDSAPAQIAAMISKNGGRTWSGKRVLQPNIGKLNVMEANLLRLHDGKIFFVFLRKNSTTSCLPFFRISTDNARTFSPPRAIPVNPDPGYYTINNDRVIQLRSGRILVPLAYTKDSRLNHRLVSTVYYSDNEGKTWKASKTMIDTRQSSVGAEEPGVVQLKDGRVMLWFRTNAGHPYQCYSRDGGVTWSAPRPMTVAAPNSPQSIKRIPSTGDLLMVWNNSATQRRKEESSFGLVGRLESQDWGEWSVSLRRRHPNPSPSHSPSHSNPRDHNWDRNTGQDKLRLKVHRHKSPSNATSTIPDRTSGRFALFAAERFFELEPHNDFWLYSTGRVHWI